MPAPVPIDQTVQPNPLLQYQFHQVAIFCPDHGAKDAMDLYKTFGFKRWIEDSAELKGFLHGDPVVTKARMYFGYSVIGGELEFLEYEGPSRHQGSEGRGRSPYISHMSAYVDDVRTTVSDVYIVTGRVPYHRFITQNHTNPAVAGKKRFIEAIYDTRELIGYDLKFIQKVPHEFDDAEWLDWQL